MQATFGHTEGAAGVTGMLLALKAIGQAAFAPVTNLCNINPYVTVALADWRQNSSSAALVPRQLAGGPMTTVSLLTSNAQFEADSSNHLSVRKVRLFHVAGTYQFLLSSFQLSSMFQ